jgi:ribonuclease P protein component
MKRNLTKKERLNKKTDFKKIFTEARTVSCKGARLLYIDNGLDILRFAVSLKRKYGNSVNRNKMKRQAREIFRLNKHRILKGKDLLFIFYPGKYSFQEREGQMTGLIDKAGLFDTSENFQYCSGCTDSHL